MNAWFSAAMILVPGLQEIMRIKLRKPRESFLATSSRPDWAEQRLDGVMRIRADMTPNASIACGVLGQHWDHGASIILPPGFLPNYFVIQNKTLAKGNTPCQ